MRLRYGSVCSGIESATVAWEPLGWEPGFFSEVEAFPRAVLEHHYPSVPLHGDFTTIQDGDYGPVDLLVAGTPCQAFSQAGRHGGLDDPRGQLAFEYCRLADRLRPRWVVWENVPGILSHDRGKAFASILSGFTRWHIAPPEDGWRTAGICEAGPVNGAYGVAWRVLDAQYLRVESHPRAVPQRRRRVFLVGYSGDWRRAVSVLFEPKSMQRYSAPQRGAEKDAARSSVESFMPCAATLIRSNNYDSVGFESHLIAFDCRAGGNTGLSLGDLPGTLRGDGHGGGHASIATESAVRRLTPKEWERLQGLPDDYTRIPWRGRAAAQCPDGPRYKAIGNSMAVNVMRWIGERIQMVDRLCRAPATAAAARAANTAAEKIERVA